jgi:hypothetical protein
VFSEESEDCSGSETAGANLAVVLKPMLCAVCMSLKRLGKALFCHAHPSAVRLQQHPNYCTDFNKIRYCKPILGRSWWPHCLSRRSWLLGSRVRIPLVAWMFVFMLICCVVLCR